MVNHLISAFRKTLEIYCNNNFSGTDSSAHDNGLIRAINSNYKPNERVVGNPKYTIFIGRLHLKTDEVQ